MTTPPDTHTDRQAWPSRISRALTFIWLLNFFFLAAAIAWLLNDPYAPRVIDRIRSGPQMVAGVELVKFPPARVPIFQATALTIALGLAIVAFALFLGPRNHRGVRSWLALTTLVALWLALLASWREFAWAGQRWRLGRQISQFERVAATLRNEWPKHDGEIPRLGHFTAYPRIEAKTLLVIADDTPPGRAPIAAVEHSDAGALRFKLAGNETGAWLEWHPPGSAPASFSGGLDTRYTLDRAGSLHDGWFLTRYR
jgi:hypothetical protein